MTFPMESLLWQIFFLVVGSLTVLTFYLIYAFSYWKRIGIPYLEPNLPFGNYNDTFFGKENFGNPTAKIYKAMKERGYKYGGCYVITKPVFVPVDPEIVKHVLIKDFPKFQDRGVYFNEKDDPLGASLFAIEKVKWRRLRNTLSPCFTSGKLKSMFQTLVQCGETLEQVIQDIAGSGQPLDIKDVSARFTTDIISSCAFGLETSSLKNPDDQFRKYGKLIFETTFSESVKGILGFIWKDILHFFRVKLTKTEVESFFMSTIKQTVEYREQNNIERKDMLDLLIKLKNNQSIEDTPFAKNLPIQKPLNPENSINFNELAAQCFVFFIGGFETSSTTMTFALLELCQNQDVQDKLRQEIREVLRNHKGILSYEALGDMTYMDKVVNETLRKYPALPFLNRELNDEWKIPGTNTTLPKGTAVFISNLGLQMDPEYYPDPEKFDPERFSEEEKAKRPTMAYLPFGDGPRNCIGARFGLIQTKVGLASFLKDYKYSIHPKTILPIVYDNNSIILSHKFGITLNIEKV